MRSSFLIHFFSKSVFQNNTSSTSMVTQTKSVLQAVKHWRTLYVSLMEAMWHLPAFRYHFCRSRKVPMNGRPVNCIVAAVWTLLTKFDTKASPVYGCSLPRVHTTSTTNTATLNDSDGTRLSSTAKASKLAAKNLQLFLHDSNEIDQGKYKLKKANGASIA